MKEFEEYLANFKEESQREKMTEILSWVHETFPELGRRIAWSEPMFTDHGTFIIGFSASKKHIAVSPEVAGITHFAKKIEEAGYSHTNNIMRITWDSPVNYGLLKEMIEFNLLEKIDCQTFWRKA
ncbi:hypothetical protein BAU15_11270 [Enterococcus sp. JM4C]|uniref:iron chaperone n=1 Tax=Candidatus Enterococcus huntleyi TaxID=1857217 RepID=UPI0013794B7A|nr:iron chaperone [Enterococcus sp. JM4C]KAF1297323.1 hypothetical protein BAU15_11270 [Enterococcus sp. JM4C]